jgi:hypothetical protein
MSTAPPHERTKLKVLACEVVAGDWTEFSGWREVVDVRPLPGKRIGLVRADGKTRRIDKFNRDDDVIVYREVTDDCL